jgi:WD40 repeat protein
LTVSGEMLSDVYLVNIELPNKYMISGVRVTEGKISGDFEVLIGMDIIQLGDFAVTNYNGRTVFSFRIPSMAHIDFLNSDEKGTIPFRECESGNLMRKLVGITNEIDAFEFSPDGKYILIRGYVSDSPNGIEFPVFLVDFEIGVPRYSFSRLDNQSLSSVGFSKDGRKMIALSLRSDTDAATTPTDLSFDMRYADAMGNNPMVLTATPETGKIAVQGDQSLWG